MGYRRHGSYLVIGRIRERQRQDAHERAVPIVALAVAAITSGKRPSGRTANVKQAIDCVLARPVLALETPTHVTRIDVSKLADAVACRERHRRVAAPRASRLSMSPVTDHTSALKGASRAKLVGHS